MAFCLIELVILEGDGWGMKVLYAMGAGEEKQVLRGGKMRKEESHFCFCFLKSCCSLRIPSSSRIPVLQSSLSLEFSFMRGKSCLANLVSFFDKITKLVDQGKPADEVFWILSKLLILSVTVSFWTKCLPYS